MSNIRHLQLGPDTVPLQQSRSPHGRWRAAYQQGAAPLSEGRSTPASLIVIHDAERLAFAMAEGPAAALLADQLADHLWTAESANGSWPENLRDWLADSGHWTETESDQESDVAPGLTGFICGRIERGLPGGRVYLAWLGMSGLRLLNRTDSAVELDTVIGDGEGWTAAHGPEPEGMALHAYRGSLFDLERLVVLSTAASALFNDLPDMANPELAQAIEDWAAESEQDLVVYDLRLRPVLNAPNSITVDYRWVTSDQVELAWQPSPNATAYRIEESATSDFAEAGLLAELTDGRQSQYRLSPPIGESRYYRVIPLNQGVAGDPSDAVSPTPIILNAPIMEPIQWADDGGYFLSWTPMAQATSYEVQVSADPDFQGHDLQIIYRGDLAETYLAHDTPPGDYYRVRALNALYAPRMPSPWSAVVRAPRRLPAPVFTSVTQQRIEWEPVRGAQQYVVRVTTTDAAGAEHSEDVAMRDTGCVVTEQRAVYHVRAFRRPGNEDTASEWSVGVTLSPKDAVVVGLSLRRVSGVLWGIGVVAVVVGFVLGWLGLEVYHDYNATSTPTHFPQNILDMTHAAGTQHAMNATSIPRTGTAIQATDEFYRNQTATATRATATPTPIDPADLTATFEAAFTAEFAVDMAATAARASATPTPIDPADLTVTFDTAFATEFAAHITATATRATATPTPIDPADLTATFEAAYQSLFATGQTATAARWTPTPTPNLTGTARADNQAALKATAVAMAAILDATGTAETAANATGTTEAIAAAATESQETFIADLTATAEAWTATPSATATPDVAETLMAGLTATAEAWTATPSLTPTPDLVATVHAVAVADAGLPPGCYVYNLSGEDLPVYAEQDETSALLATTVPQFAVVLGRDPGQPQPRVSPPLWLQVSFTLAAEAPVDEDATDADTEAQPPETITGWLLVRPGLDENLIYGGTGCPDR